MDLFSRDAKITLGSTVIQMRDVSKVLVPSLRFSFKSVLSVFGCQGQTDLTIYNLSKDHRVAFQTKGTASKIEAGYVTGKGQIFSGKVFFAHSVLDNVDWITKVQLVDGLLDLQQARVNYSNAGPVTLDQLGKDVLKELGLDFGNSGTTVNSDLRKLIQWSNGLTLSGAADKVLDKISGAIGRKWFVQNGAVNFLGNNEVLVGGDPNLLLAPGKGMIGSPQAGDDGVLKVRSLLMPDLLPGRAIYVQSKQVKAGRYRIEKTTFLGDSWGGDWYADLELRVLR